MKVTSGSRDARGCYSNIDTRIRIRETVSLSERLRRN
jgi:hypothetical protein